MECNDWKSKDYRYPALVFENPWYWSVLSWLLTAGNIMAIAVSYSIHKSILWACIHGSFGWIYLLYAALRHWV